MQRPVVLTPEIRCRAEEVQAYALAHPYYPGKTKAPGLIPHHILDLPFGYHCVFSFTVARELWHRHLSVSVGHGVYPGPYALLELAFLFGFTEGRRRASGFPFGWEVALSREPNLYAVLVVEASCQ